MVKRKEGRETVVRMLVKVPKERAEYSMIKDSSEARVRAR